MDPVIIVGAGPVGLSLALALARLGVPSLVLDETTGQEDTRPARTAVLRAETAAFVGRLGCADALESDGTRWTAWRIMRRRRLVERVAFAPRTPDDEAGPSALASPVHLPQHTLTRALRAALAREKLAEVVTGGRLIDLEQDAHGVSAHTRGANGTWWRGSYLIGCDGPRSTVRKLLDIRFPGRTAVERHAVAALRCELPWPGEALLHRSPPRQGGGPGSEVSARPLADGVWRLDWLLPPGRELVTPEALVARIRDSLAGWTAESPAGAPPGYPAGSSASAPADGTGPDAGGTLSHGHGHGHDHGHGRLVPPYELLDTGVHTVHHRLARCWRQGRTFLAGDAAHLLGALGTQGLDEGLRDAENLAWKLSLAWHHGASETLLDSYQDERRAAVAARLRAADQALPLLRDGGSARWRTVLPGAARGRSTLLTDGHLGRGPLGAPPVYGRTPLAPPAEHTGGPLTETPAGAPVTDVPVTASDGSVVRLRDRLGQGLLVVLVAPGTTVWDRRHWRSAGLMPQLTSAVAALPMPAEVLVTESYPGAAAHTVLLVRPDGHLVTALSGVRPAEMSACAAAVRGGDAGAGAGSRAGASARAGARAGATASGVSTAPSGVAGPIGPSSGPLGPPGSPHVSGSPTVSGSPATPGPGEATEAEAQAPGREGTPWSAAPPGGEGPTGQEGTTGEDGPTGEAGITGETRTTGEGDSTGRHGLDAASAVDPVGSPMFHSERD
ncbi:putative monooxygenase [Streptomyces sp. NBRC 110611]|uniref:FAD-dependent monooxygenase n=1 Tax=Streptomyces sp. NBRC 110611 TaxID=1621259 RepID=UPI000855FF87|nr:FAD-dependent monooxygenase [Streptomyces sp. NBRC 110611]GAU69641.1 putative monooxygenase [Streptomyces sp. NBRC 110611]